MIFALDTNIISEARKPRPHGAVLAWLESHPIAAFAIPSFVFLELQEGVEKVRLQDAAKAIELEAWMARLLRTFAILPFTAEAARETALLMQKQSRELLEDAAIAATAKVHGLTIATRNVRDFERFKVPLVNPFQHRA